MKKFVTCTLILSIVGLAVAKDVVGKSYDFSVPEAVTFEMNEQVEMYTFHLGTPPAFGLFILHVNPAPMPAAAIGPMVDIMALAFKDQMEKQPSLELVSIDQKLVEVGLFKGTEVAFTVKHSAGMMMQYIFVLFDGEKCWNGQLTGSGTNDLEQVYSILKSARRKVGKEEKGPIIQ